MLIRRATRADAGQVSWLASDDAFADFLPGKEGETVDESTEVVRKFVEEELVLKSILAVTATDDQGRIVAFASFDDSPTKKDGRASAAEDSVAGAGTSNTLFLTSWFGHPDAGKSVAALRAVMKAVFDTMPQTDFVFAFTASQSANWSTFASCGFRKTGARAPCEHGPDASVCSRIEYRANLATRTAQVEDYDDLVKIFDAQSAVLTSTYGEYFLAELIESQDENNYAVVADIDGKAVGLMCVSSEIDMDLLKASFQLEPFDGFKKLAAYDSESKHAEGDSNVFAITLFCVDQEHGSRTCDILESAFECFPDKEYCALTLPNDKYERLLLPYFFQIPVRDGASLSHSLYAIHRDSLRALRRSFLRSPQDEMTSSCEEKSPDSSAEMPPGWVRGSQLESCFAHEGDVDAIVALVNGVETSKEIIRDVRESFQDDSNLTAICVNVLGQTVGVLVIETFDGAHDARVQMLDHFFDLRGVSGIPNEGPSKCGVTHALLRHISIVPIFAQFSRSVLRDAMRMLDLHILHFKLFPGELAPSAVLENMAQVRPRRIAYLQRQHRKRHLNEPRDKAKHFSLYTLPKASLSEPRIILNTRIVVVGASETGLAYLEQLLLNPHTHFPNLTLVAPGGIPDERIDGVRALCTQGASKPGGFDSRFSSKLGLLNRLNVIDDRMVYLERDAQAIVLSDGSLLEYDYLVVASGLQDTTLQTTCMLRDEDLKSCKPLSDSVYAIGSDPLRAAAMQRLIRGKHAISKEQSIVYGKTVEAFAAVQVLLDAGKHGKYITLVHPGSEEEWLEAFGSDVWVGSKISEELAAAGVNVVHGLELCGIERVHDQGRISSALFVATGAASVSLPTSSSSASRVISPSNDSRELGQEPGTNSLKEHAESRLAKNGSGKRAGSKQTFVDIPCGLLVCATAKNIDRDIFTSINDSGLVYDGRTVVDADFQTVDPRIIAIGTNTKFSRRYRFDHTLEAFNSQELGRVAAQCLLRKIDPLSKPWSEDEQKDDIRVSTLPFASKLPRFSQPKHMAQSVELPGSIRYYRACRPGWDETTARFKVLETASPDAFCKLQVDRFGFVASVSYAVNDTYALREDSKEDFPEEKVAEAKCADELSQEDRRLAGKRKNRFAPFDRLVDIHVSYLNDLENQLACGEIADLIEFLSRDWAFALYHDHFANFCQMLKLNMSSTMDDELAKVIEALREEYGSPDKEDLDIIAVRDRLIGSGGQNLTKYTLDQMRGPLKNYFDLHDKIFEIFEAERR